MCGLVTSLSLSSWVCLVFFQDGGSASECLAGRKPTKVTLPSQLVALGATWCLHPIAGKARLPRLVSMVSSPYFPFVGKVFPEYAVLLFPIKLSLSGFRIHKDLTILPRGGDYCYGCQLVGMSVIPSVSLPQ